MPQGATAEQARIDPEFVKTELEPVAVEKVKGWLILEAIADREGIRVSDKEIDESLEKMAKEVNLAPEDVKRLIISREGSLVGLAQKLREDKALDLVASKAIFGS